MLEKLDLKDNLIGGLPESFGNLSNLQELDLKANEVLNLPTSFSKLNSLEVLNIAFNFNIENESVGMILSKMKNLKLVDISDSYFPEDVVNKMRSANPNTTFKAVNLVKK